MTLDRASAVLAKPIVKERCNLPGRWKACIYIFGIKNEKRFI